MEYKSTILNYRIKVNELFTRATNQDYFNLFQPVIPKIDLTGKIAQIISAATEAVTVWLICQSELSEVNHQHIDGFIDGYHKYTHQEQL